MKKTTTCLLMIFMTICSYGQQTSADAFTLSAGGTFGKSKIPKELNKLGIAEFRVKYYSVITKSSTLRESSRSAFGRTQGKAVTGKVSSYLETTDGDLVDADFVEITNHGYNYFTKKLKENGIDTVAWNTIEGTEFYIDNGKEKVEDDQEDDQANGNAASTYNAFNGNTMYGGKIGSFSMRGKKVSRMSEAAGAPLLYANIALEFADIDIDLSVKTGGAYKSSWTPSTSHSSTAMSSETKVVPLMKITNNIKGLYSILVNDNNRMETVGLSRDIWAEQDYATKVFNDEARAEKKKNKFFSVSLSKKLVSTPVVIETTRAQYKAAAKKALERYADGLIAKFLEMKNG